ncbi:glycosyltransferase family 2 protein [Vallitalea okinawensis]|uniref:glycosyltransferase family 2 protein n=1 Tax=Vallitalea okinawensis TaxID=2078660 RepID=UPI000CFC979D|nr:glycosyltransferase family 2 protein [Vallitalea okinawensis]
MVDLSIVIPVYNGAKSIETLCYEIDANLNNFTYEILLVDDGSKDDSYEVMKRLSHQFKQIKSIKLRENAGQQNTLLCGIRHVTGAYCITMDDDGQHDPGDIPLLYKKIKEGYNVVYGIPFQKQHAKYRSIGTMLTDWLFNTIIGKPKAIKISSYRIMTSDVVKIISRYPYRFIYLSAVIFHYTKRVANIPINHRKRKEGSSNYNLSRLLRLYMKLITYFTPCLKPFRKHGNQYEIEEITQ